MNRRQILVLTFLTVFLIFLAVMSFATGSVRITPGELFASLCSGEQSPAARIICSLRLPRILGAVVLGGALSVSGFLLQVFFSNPIAGPYVLGISSGAKLMVAMTMIMFLKLNLQLTSLALVASAFLGSLLTMGFVLLLSLRVHNMSMLVVCGILVGYICSAITDFAVTFASDTNIVNLHNWSLGSFSAVSWKDVLSMSLVVFPVMLFVFLLSKPIGAYQLGENYARNSGVNIKFLRVSLILLSSLLSACVTAFAGPVSFVGIAVPHLVKLSANTTRPLVAVPLCFIGGSCVTLLCDTIARTVFAPVEMSISSVTAFMLVPVVIIMMVRKQGRA